MDIEVVTVPVTSFQQNCRVLISPQEGAAIIIDPGGEAPKLLELLEKRGVELKEIWLTHSHLDHCGGVAGLLENTKVPLFGHRAEESYRARVEEICALYGIPSRDMKNCPEPSEFFEGGESLSFGGKSFEVRFCPGHSPGHVVFYCEELSLLLAGDTLFAGSIGRTDLPGGNHEQLLSAIREQLYSLPDDTAVLPGHGPDTTIGVEKRTNPFVRAESGE